MDRKRAIELLKQYLEEIRKLRNLHDGDQAYELWVSKVSDVIEAGLEPKDRVTFASAHYESNIVHVIGPDDYGKPSPTYYQENINVKETALKKIIQKYEILVIEDKPATKEEQKDTFKSPIQLFDAMQFHHKVVKASRALFENEHYAQAIFEAFKAVENFVQDKSGLSLYGSNLMEKVFNEEDPIIKVPEAGYYDKDVQKGFKHLFVGAAQGIRNPKAHKDIVQKDPHITLEYLGFASFLLKRIDYWEASIS